METFKTDSQSILLGATGVYSGLASAGEGKSQE